MAVLVQKLTSFLSFHGLWQLENSSQYTIEHIFINYSTSFSVLLGVVLCVLSGRASKRREAKRSIKHSDRQHNTHSHTHSHTPYRFVSFGFVEVERRAAHNFLRFSSFRLPSPIVICYIDPHRLNAENRNWSRKCKRNLPVKSNHKLNVYMTIRSFR